MFIIKCQACGREQQWGEKVVLGQTEIEVADRSLFCACGHYAEEENETIHEGIADEAVM